MNYQFKLSILVVSLFTFMLLPSFPIYFYWYSVIDPFLLKWFENDFSDLNYVRENGSLFQDPDRFEEDKLILKRLVPNAKVTIKE